MKQDSGEQKTATVPSNKLLLNNSVADIISSDKIVIVSKSFAKGIPGVIVEANDTACKILGYTIENLRSMSFYDIIIEEDYKTLELKNEILNQDEYAEYILNFKAKNGKNIKLNIISFLLSTNGEIVELIIAEKEHLKPKKEQKFTTPKVETFNFSFLQNSGIATLIINSNMKILQSNSEFLNISGYTSKQLKSLKLNQILKKDFLGNNFEKSIFDVDNYDSFPLNLKSILLNKNDRHLYVQLYIGLIEETKDFIIILFDITGQSILQNALAKSEEKYRLLFMNAVDMIFVYSLSNDGERSKFIEVNQIASEILGFSKDELLQMTLNDIVKEDFEGQLDNHAKEMSSQKEEILKNKTASTFQGKSSFITKSGEIVPIEYSVSFLVIESEFLILTIVRDIRERLRAKKTLERDLKINSSIAELQRKLLEPLDFDVISESVLNYAEELTESSVAYVVYFNQDDGFLFTNSKSQETLRHKEIQDGKIVFKEFPGFLGWIIENKGSIISNSPQNHPLYKEIPQGHIPVERFISVPSKVKDKTVGQITVVNSVRKYTEKDLEIIKRLANIFAIAIDRKRAEEQIYFHNQFLISTIESITYPFIVIDADNHSVVLANKAAQNLYARDLSSIEDIKCYQFTQRSDIPCELCGIICPLSVIKDSRKPFSVDHFQYDSNGEEVIFEIHGSPIFSKNGDLIHIIESIIEVTEKRKAEKQLKESENIYRTAFEINVSANAIISEDLMIKQMNSKMKLILGYQNSETRINKDLKVYYPPKEQIKIKEHIQKRKNNPNVDSAQYETFLIDRFGKRKNVVGYIDLIQGTSDTFVSFFDLTEIKNIGKLF